jgi:hypothetical protein
MSMMRSSASFLLALCALAPLSLAQRHPDKASPFDGVRWEQGRPEVLVADEWYGLLAVDETDTDDILAALAERWGADAQRKRFAEDLVEGLLLMDVQLGPAVDLRVVRLSDGEELVLRGIANTYEKRSALWLANNFVNEARASAFDRRGAEADLAAFGDGLRRRFAYVRLRGIDLDAELQLIAEALPEHPRVEDLAEPLDHLLKRFGDGHAGVSADTYAPTRVGPFLPFLLADAAEGVVAFRSDRSGFVDDEHPILSAIDGFPIDACIAAVSPEIAAGSPQLVRRRGLEHLRNYGLWRPRMGDEAGLPRTITLQLASLDGQRTRQMEAAPADVIPTYGEWPRTFSREIGATLGYLRIPSMNGAAVTEVRRAMAAFRGTDGLIVDVRGNGGGSRAALIELAGYLTDPKNGHWIGNVAAYRAAEFPSDHLEARSMHPADWSGWDAPRAAAIEGLAAHFEPEWEPPEDFSDWHYLVLGPTGADDEYHYTGRVIVLSDAGCFSATDIFLGALERLPQVVLLGSPSSGGSARRQVFTLPNSGIEVGCASMASFRPDGRLYDTRGIEVDVGVPAGAGFFLTGGADRALEAAIVELGGDPADWLTPSAGLAMEGDPEGFVRDVVAALASEDYAQFEALSVLGMAPGAFADFARDSASHPYARKISRVWDTERNGFVAARHAAMRDAFAEIRSAAASRGLAFADARVADVRWKGDGDDMHAVLQFGDAHLRLAFDDCFLTPDGIRMFDPPAAYE